MRRTLKSTVSGVLSRVTSHSLHPYDKASRNGNIQQTCNQVFRLPLHRLHVCAVVFLLLIVSSCVAYPNPRIEAQKGRKPGAVYFRTDCRPLTEEQLQKRMGTYFDSSKMASNEDSLKLGAGAVQGGDFNSDEDLDDIQGDDPDAYSEDVLYEEEEDDDGEEDEDYVEDKLEEDEKSGSKYKVYKYMRKRRGISEEDEAPHRGSHVTKRGSSDFGTLHLKLALSGRKNNGHRSHDGKSRKQLKKELREKVRKSNKDPPWECKMTPEYKKMRDGIFPRYVTDGRCVTDKCFFRIYNCVPKKYRIRLLERDPDRCNPLPLIGTNTTYEEKWYFRNYFVTVGCNCERRKQKKRKRH